MSVAQKNTRVCVWVFFQHKSAHKLSSEHNALIWEEEQWEKTAGVSVLRF